MFAYFVGNSTYSFTLILVMHLAGIAIGSWLIGNFADKFSHPSRILMWLQLGAAASLLIALFSFGGVFRTFLTAPAFSWMTYLSSTLIKTGLILLPPTILMGCIFPLLNRILLRTIHNIGPRLGRLYALNTLGAIVGSLLAGFFLIRIIGVSTSIAISAMLYALSALLIAFTLPKKSFRQTGIGAAAVGVIAMGFIALKVNGYQLATWEELKADQVLFYKEGVSATVKVYHSEGNNRGRVLTANGSMIGADNRSIMRKQSMLAHLPMLVLPEVRKGFSVGLGTGVTLSEMLKYPLDRVVCAEISEAVVDASRQFSHVNHLDYNDPRIQWIVDDGKIWLANTKEKFDLISSDTMLRRGSSGNGRMYTADYYRLALNHLTPNGAFIQWAPAYLQPNVHKTIVRTFTSVFPYVTGWYIGNETLLLMGTKQPVTLSVAALRERYSDSRIRQVLDWIDFPDWPSLVSTLIFNKVSLNTYAGAGPLNTLNNPLVEFAAPRNFSPNENVGLFLRNALPDMITPDANNTDIFLTDMTAPEMTVLTKYAKIYSLVIRGIAARILAGEVQGKHYLVEALALDTKNPHVLYFLGLSPHAPKNHLKSKLYLDTAVICKEQNQLDLAYSLLDSSLTIDPHNIIAYNQYYTWLAESGDIRSAINIAVAAVQNNPDVIALQRDLEYFKSLFK